MIRFFSISPSPSLNIIIRHACKNVCSVLVFITETTTVKKGNRMTHKLIVLIWRWRGKQKRFGWWHAEELVGWFQYNLTCFTASSLKQAFASEIDQASLAECLRRCLCATDFLIITAISKPLHCPWLGEQCNCFGHSNLFLQLHRGYAPVSLLSVLTTPVVSASVSPLSHTFFSAFRLHESRLFLH